MKVLLGENPGQKKIGPYAIKDVTATNTEHTGDLDTRTGIAVDFPNIKQLVLKF